MQFLPVTHKNDQMLGAERNYSQQAPANDGPSFFSLFASSIEDQQASETNSFDFFQQNREEDRLARLDREEPRFESSKVQDVHEPVLDRENFASIRDDIEEVGVSKEKINEWEEDLERDRSIPVRDVLQELQKIDSQTDGDLSTQISDRDNKSLTKNDEQSEKLDKLIAVLEKLIGKDNDKEVSADELRSDSKADKNKLLVNFLQILGYSEKESEELVSNQSKVNLNKQDLIFIKKDIAKMNFDSDQINNFISLLEKLGIKNEYIKGLSSKLEANTSTDKNLNKDQFKELVSLLEKLGVKEEYIKEFSSKLEANTSTSTGKTLNKDQFKELLTLLEKLGVKNEYLKGLSSQLNANAKSVELSSKQIESLQNLVQKGLDKLSGSEQLLSENQQKNLKSILSSLGMSQAKLEKLFPDSGQKTEGQAFATLSNANKKIVLDSSKEQNTSDKNGKIGDQNVDKQFSVKQVSKLNTVQDNSNASGNQQGNKDNNSGNQEQNSKRFLFVDSSFQENNNSNLKSMSSSNFLNTFQSENSDKLTEYLTNSSSFAKKGASNLSREELLRQIENGVFKNLEDGKKQLTLKLDPPDLGKLHVILQIKNKEVSAVFKTENNDVHRIMNEQVAHLKQGLEQQGLKVNKIEIQTHNQNSGTFDHWLGEEGHNQAKERNQNFAKSERQRKWRKFQEDTEAQETAQDMLLNRQMDKISSGGLYVVA